MLRLALMFFIIAVVAALFGFGGLATATAEIAKFIFFIFTALLVLALVFGALDQRHHDPEF